MKTEVLVGTVWSTNKLNPHVASNPEIYATAHWWRAGALTTALALLPLSFRELLIDKTVTFLAYLVYISDEDDELLHPLYSTPRPNQHYPGIKSLSLMP